MCLFTLGLLLMMWDGLCDKGYRVLSNNVVVKKGGDVRGKLWVRVSCVLGRGA